MICPICGLIMENESGKIEGKTYNRVCLMCGHKSYIEKEVKWSKK